MKMKRMMTYSTDHEVQQNKNAGSDIFELKRPLTRNNGASVCFVWWYEDNQIRNRVKFGRVIINQTLHNYP